MSIQQAWITPIVYIAAGTWQNSISLTARAILAPYSILFELQGTHFGQEDPNQALCGFRSSSVAERKVVGADVSYANPKKYKKNIRTLECARARF